MVKWLGHMVATPDWNHLRSGEWKTPSVHQAAKGYKTLFTAGEGDGHHLSHAMPNWHKWNPNIPCPYGQPAMDLYTFTFYLTIIINRQFSPKFVQNWL